MRGINPSNRYRLTEYLEIIERNIPQGKSVLLIIG